MDVTLYPARYDLAFAMVALGKLDQTEINNCWLCINPNMGKLLV